MTVNLYLDFGDTLAGVFRLQPDAFVQAAAISHEAVVFGLIIVLAAGFSEAVAQSIVLFANRVKPARFFFSWAVDALLFVFGYGFLVASTWAICTLTHGPPVTFKQLAVVFAISYAPLFFSFLGALPYLGPGILTLLRIWHLLAMVVGFTAVAGASLVHGALYVALGWVVMVLAQQSFGRPIVELGTKILDAVAGVKLIGDEEIVVGRIEQGLDLGTPRATEAPAKATPSAHPAIWKSVAGLVAIGIFTVVIALALDPVRDAVFGWQTKLPDVVQVPLDLLWLGVIAFIVSAFLAPLETLGWWAGWYGDRIDTSAEEVCAGDAASDGVARYVVYLDGIAQSSSQYTPDIETFLDALAPRLPSNVRLIRGVIVYSVMNRPLEEDPFFSLMWKFIDAVRMRKVGQIFSAIVNLRNVFIVAVSADSRYGPMYNFGVAQTIYKSLIAHGYALRSGVPVTLIGYSGGGQMACGSAAFLRHAIDAPLDVISLGGVISGDDQVLVLEHLHHLVGDRDNVERIGPVMFPSRWKIAVLSNWNRAKRLGRLTQLSLGPVGHQVPGGMLDPELKLPDGRSSLQQTIDYINDIVGGRWETIDPGLVRTSSEYEKRAVARRTADAPGVAAPNPDRYRPTGEWIGRLALPTPGERFGGVWMSVTRAPSEHRDLAGTTVRLMFAQDDPALKEMLRAVTRDVNLSAEARYTSSYRGLVHPLRLDRWRLVNPLESLAGARPYDDALVKLTGNVRVETGESGVTIRVDRTPVQIAGPYYGLVRFLETQDGANRSVEHYDAVSGSFTGASRQVRLVVPVADLETSPLNDLGWYVYGDAAADGTFEVSAIVPRLWLRPPPALLESGDAYRLYRSKIWRIVTGSPRQAISAATHERWSPGDTALLVLTAGGNPIGRFAYGIAQVIADPLAGELRFEATYFELYPSNTQGNVSGPADAARCIGDLYAGEAASAPVAQAVLAHGGFPLEALAAQLEAMCARYRIGDGTGGTYDGIANNCSQDSNRALFAALRSARHTPHGRPLVQRLRRRLAPFGGVPREWRKNAYDLGSTFEDAPIPNLVRGLRTWRCILPRLAAEAVAKSFVQEHAEMAVAGMPAFSARGGQSSVAPLTFWP